MLLSWGFAPVTMVPKVCDIIDVKTAIDEITCREVAQWLTRKKVYLLHMSRFPVSMYVKVLRYVSLEKNIARIFVKVIDQFTHRSIKYIASFLLSTAKLRSAIVLIRE